MFFHQQHREAWHVWVGGEGGGREGGEGLHQKGEYDTVQYTKTREALQNAKRAVPSFRFVSSLALILLVSFLNGHPRYFYTHAHANIVGVQTDGLFEDAGEV